MTQLNLSARAYHRILKLARTIADLAEALQYRPKLMISWQEDFCRENNRSVSLIYIFPCVTLIAFLYI